MQTASTGTGTAEQVLAWAASGAMQLTGRADGPALGPPLGLVPRLRQIADLLSERTESLGCRVDLDPLRLLGERAALKNLTRRGSISCGEATRLIPTEDGWIAVALSRPEDVDLLPAWLDLPGPSAEPWQAVTSAAERSKTRVLVERATTLGLPVAELGERSVDASQNATRSPELPMRVEAQGTAACLRDLRGVVVVDLTSLWAGPLCGSLLDAGGADVIKVEATHRPDGTRRGPPAFSDLLNGGKRSVALDVQTAHGRNSLAALLATADVVLEASRPRALEQLGIDRSAFLDHGRIRVWATITGYGRGRGDRDRVAFGDDAAVAGGLVSWDNGRPNFCADAIADPATGLVVAAAVADLLHAGDRWTVDVAMADVAAHLAGPTLPVPNGVDVAAPHARRPARRAPALGQHTDEIVTSLRGRADRRGRGQSGPLAPGEQERTSTASVPCPAPRATRVHEQTGLSAPSESGVTGELFLRDVAVDGRRLDVLVVEGVIEEMGTSLRPAGDPKVIDGDGGALLPGLHDHHLHLLATAAARASVAVGPVEARDLHGLATLLQEADASMAPGRWIRAVGYHEEVAGTLDRHTLDSVLSHRPVRVQHRTGAQWTLNTAAIESLGLETTSHAGAERDPSGRLTGRFHRADDWLMSRWPDPGPLDLAGLGAELANYGITGVTDSTPFRSIDRLEPLAKAAAAGALPQRIIAMGGVGIAGSPFPAPLTPGPVKLVIDDADYPALDILEGSISRAHAYGLPVAIHCVTRTSLVLAMAAWGATGSRSGDRIEHGSVIPPETFHAIAQLGLHVVTQPAFVADRGDQYLTNVEPADLPHLYRCRSLQEAGIPVAASSDAPYSGIDPWAAMRAAATRHTTTGRALGLTEAVSPVGALALYLGHPARPGGEPRRVVIGAPADLCLLDGPLPTEIRHLRADRVVATIVAGRVVATDRS